jgi:hypothetical protein
MKLKIPVIIGSAVFVGSVTLLIAASAQRRGAPFTSRAIAYNAAHETLLKGTVLGYTERSVLPPIGAHVALQTPTGAVDVHLGPASYLHAKNFSLAPGDSVGFVGTVSRTGKSVVFLARIAQKGNESLVIRSPRGFLMAPFATRNLSAGQRTQATQQAGAR